MGRIQSNIGLITGIPIAETVDKLMQIAAKPRDLLIQRTSGLKEEQIALTELSALLVSVQYIAKNLGKEDLYDQRSVASSNPDVLSATLTGSPPIGTYQFTPLRMARHHQFLSSGVRSATDPLGGGRITFRFGPHVEQGLDLGVLRGGQGVDPGAIRITDRSGASAVIDLSTVQTVDDVLEAINGSMAINVTAVADGDHIRLIDHTGQSVSNLKVQEIGGGTTAASLGLAGIDVAAASADGQDVLWLSDDVELDLINDGSGLSVDRIFDDIEYTLRDGTTGTIDLSPIISGGSEVDEETTLGELLEVINAAAPGKLELEVAPDGERLLLTDLTAGSGEFTVRSLYESAALEDLGLDGPASDGVITGRRILGGLKTVLLSSLEGGQGLGDLGQLALTDRSGATDTVDLAGTETLDEAIQIINAAAVGIVAQVNQARNGIELVDTTGASAGNLIVANADETATADKLGLAIDAEVNSVNSGDMHLRIIASNTLLSDLNGGAGVASGSLTIYDTTGSHAQLTLTGDDATVGDLIRQINRLGLQIQAELNETGDGIRIRDLAHGTGSLQVVEGSSTTAADLHLLGGAVQVDIEGQPTQVIDGSTTHVVELSETDTLEDLRQKIEDLGAGVQATTLWDGSSKPLRLLLQSERPGSAGQLVFDTSQINLSLQETVPAQDALLMLGQPGSMGPSVLVSSSSNTFTDVISGLRLEIKQPSSVPVTVTVGTTDADLIASVEVLVENYNRFRDKLDELTRYDLETETASILTGDATALRLDVDLAHLLSGRFEGAGSIRSLREVGISLNDDGTLELDSSKLEAKLAEDPEAVRQFFADENQGLSAKLGGLIERLSGEQNSLLAERLKVLDYKIEQNEEKIAFFDERLDAQRERMLLQFYRLELAIGKMQSSLSALEALQPVPPLTSTRQE